MSAFEVSDVDGGAVSVHPPNFRDVGEALCLWYDGAPVTPGRLCRGGRFDTLTKVEDLGSPATILNLRRGFDPPHLGLALLHVPAPDDVENYDTSRRPVRAWIEAAVAALLRPETRWPVYVHCTSGRDRTGVVIAAILALLGVPEEIIVEEYMLSEGADRRNITHALAGLRSAPLRSRVDVSALRDRTSLASDPECAKPARAARAKRSS